MSLRSLVIVFLIVCRVQFLHAQKDSTQILELIGHAGDLIRSKPDSTKLLGDSAFNVSNQQDYTKGKILSLHVLGDYELGAGEYENALNYFMSALELSSEADSLHLQAVCYNKLGTVFTAKQDQDKALEYFFLADKELTSYGTNQEHGMLYSQIGMTYRRKFQFDSSLFYHKKALAIAEQEKDEYGISACLNNIGATFGLVPNPDSALHYMRRALSIKIKIGDKRGVANTRLNIGNELYKIKSYDSALVYLQQGIETAKEMSLFEYLSRGYGIMQAVYGAKGDYKKAFEYLTLYKDYSDSLLNEKSEKSINEIEARYQNKIKAKEIKALNLENSIANAEAENQSILKIIFGLAFLIAAIAALFIFRNYKRKSRDADTISLQKREIESQKNIVEAKQHEVLDSIRYARRLQLAILPPEKIWKDKLQDAFILYLPKDIVAGDFYWMETLESNSKEYTCFAVADCTGHGVPGALVSVVCSNALNRAVKEYKLNDPGDILNKVRELVISTFEKSESEVKDGMDISLCVYEPVQKQLLWAGANNPIWIVKANTNELTEIAPNKQPVGVYISSNPFTTHRIQLEKDDVFYLFTDGYADQFGGEKGKKFKYSQLRTLILSLHAEDMEVQKTILHDTMMNWKGELEQIDDVCFMGVRVH